MRERLTRWFSAGRALVRLDGRARHRLERDVDDEIALHVESRVDALVRQGLDRHAARRHPLDAVAEVDRERRQDERQRATRGQMLRMVLRDGLATTGVGVALGLALAAGTTRSLQALLCGVSATDVRISPAVALAVGLAALVASDVPARGAVSTDPIAALRAD